MKIKTIVLLIILISISGCKNKSNKVATPETNSTENISLLDTLKLTLNHGEKWVVNNETQIGVIKMDSIIESFKVNESNDFINLGQDLSKQTSFIIKSCDMTGEAHDQLHVVLVPMLDQISTLKDSNTLEESKRALNELENLISSYNTHFKFQ